VRAAVFGITIVWTALCVWGFALANQRVAEYERQRPGSAGLFGGVVPLGYALLLWSMKFIVMIPVIVAVAVWMLRRPELARQGRITLAYVAFPTCLVLWLWSLLSMLR
jgi:hypothetical protein